MNLRCNGAKPEGPGALWFMLALITASTSSFVIGSKLLPVASLHVGRLVGKGSGYLSLNCSSNACPCKGLILTPLYSC